MEGKAARREGEGSRQKEATEEREGGRGGESEGAKRRRGIRRDKKR